MGRLAIRDAGNACVVVVLILCAASTWFMAGVGWLVQVVQYPLFAAVGRESFPEYHRLHSQRITPVVFPAMAIELVSSGWLLFSPPSGTSFVLVVAGFALALATWLATALLAVPRHADLGAGFDPAVHSRLVRSSWVRTVAWSAHGVIVAVLLWQAAG